ncbi:NADH-quinone oxidoreductase subunit NuoG [Thalassotalea litorea]|uniref:NADH-quinone oxidoreductase subunit G n=1 Tax=Thalassotalea litorea TaxID=2020715 RepID=A0A5R9IF79_9GAMM|nr:NADH-quinone oxidoreductase subunit NuoG [Thalassotalea litorea]TLU64185.1 NADH-quinone oxidoreductase subunit NuoG [Thalassotalea litorea]
MDKFQPNQSTTQSEIAKPMEVKTDLVTVHVDGKAVQLPKGENLLAAILSKKYNLPYFCWHPSMGSIGACRQCAITQFTDETQQKGRTIMACMTPVVDGMFLGLEHAPAAEFREQVIAAMMTNHPHDCPVCGEGGACHLQDMTVMTGHSHRQYQGLKRTFTNQYLGPLVNHEMNRCITCYRCERFYKDYAGGKDFSACGSKNQVYFGRQQDGVLESEFAGNLVEVCPTGVFTDKPFAAHYTRKWDLQSAPSICHGCAVGCNISVGERYGSVRRVINRYHNDINGYFICDKGRFGFAYVNGDDRINKISGIELATAFKPHEFSIAMARHNAKTTVGIGSARASQESNAALKQLVGRENFCSGLTELQQECLRSCQALMLQNRQASISDIEQSDCIIVLDEDLTQTSARIALAVRQATRNAAFDKAEQMGIPRWQDDAVRTAAQDLRSDLYLLQSKSCKLDDVAAFCEPMLPEQILELARDISDFANNPHPLGLAQTRTEGSHSESQTLLSRIVQSLQHAKRPVIIAGCSHWHLALLQAVEKLATHAPKNWQFALLPDAVNAMGLVSLMDEHTLSLEQLQAKDLSSSAVIAMENSLPAWSSEQRKQLAEQAETLVVIDHSRHQLSELADIVLPATAFTESDGVAVNYQGLAQPFFAVKPQVKPMHSSWQWCQLLDDVFGQGTLIGLQKLSQLRSYLTDNVTGYPDMNAMFAQHLLFKSARQPMRYSGRTAMIANQTVHEPKNPVDSDSPYSFSMEGPGNDDGYGHALPRSFSWAPGWNSNQSISKYQVKVGGVMSNRADMIRLVGQSEPSASRAQTSSSAKRNHRSQRILGLQLRQLEHLFANDEFAGKIAEFNLMAPPPCLLINTDDTGKFNQGTVSHVRVELTDNSSFIVQLIPCADIAKGVAYLHHPRANTSPLLDLVVSISTVSDADISAHQQQLSENLEQILQQKNRNLARLQQTDQRIPIQIVGEGS